MEKHLQNEEGLKKFRQLAEDIRVCMFITNNQIENHTRPMATIEVETDGTLWFFTDIRSIKVEEVSLDRTVHLVYSHPGKESYMDVWGRAEIVTDRDLIKEKWSPLVKAWFPDPLENHVALLKIKPLRTYYWDAGAGKMVQFLKTAASAVTGTKLADGAEGKIMI